MHLLVNRYNKVLYFNGTTYTDYTDKMMKWDSQEMPITLNTGHYIYIGCPHSFASRFFKIKVANDQVARLTVEYYYGKNNWRSVKNLCDMTAIGGIPFSQSSFLCWDLPDDWVRNQINAVPDLPYESNTGDSYGYYWVRIKSNAILKATTALNWLGLIWTDQSYMLSYWPEVLSTAYLPAGKSDWYELIEYSTGDVADDLNISNLIDYELQIKDIDEVAKLTALKTMINILVPIRASETLRLMRESFEKTYNNLLRKRMKSIDQNEDEKISPNEKTPFANARIVRE